MDTIATSEACSTPRVHPHNPVETLVSEAPKTQQSSTCSPTESEESEADVLERSIRLSSGFALQESPPSPDYKIQQLTNDIEPTTVFSGSIMHTAESPSKMTVNPLAFQQYMTTQPNVEPIPSAPTLQQIQSHPSSQSVPLIDMSTFKASPTPPPGSLPSKTHLGKRPSGDQILPPPCDTQPVTNTHNISQDQMNISLSPITSPNTKVLLKPSVHWYYSNPDGSWTPFSYLDSEKLEDCLSSVGAGQDQVVRTDGGRYDVHMGARQRVPVYWDGLTSAIRRCSWFYRGNNDIMQPYNEDKAKILEEHYVTAVKVRSFPMRVELGHGETVIINSQTMMVQYSQQNSDAEQNAPRLVKRGVPDEDKVPPYEKEEIDHLVFVLHGIGSVGDIKLRSFVDCVTDMRVTSQQLLLEHWPKIDKSDKSVPGRIEYLPIQWHAALHSDKLGVDNHMDKLTLPSIPMLRDFVNSTLVDILFYTSPYYCEAITEQCCSEMNRLYTKFLSRNQSFAGKVSVTGHSLGSVIAFDILSQQSKDEVTKDFIKEQQPSLNTSSTCYLSDKEPGSTTEEEGSSDDDVGSSDHSVRSRYHSVATSHAYRRSKLSTSEVSGTGQPQVTAASLLFEPQHLFSLGSPLGLFLTVRGVSLLGPGFKLPTCKRFFNIFHPYDPVAYKLEPMINKSYKDPVILPHHKGRKRMHKEITAQIVRVGAAVKNQISNTLLSFYNSSQTQSVQDEEKAPERDISGPVEQLLKDNEMIRCGLLNNGDRIDYVLQESPLEIVNEYLFSLSSHLCYWSSHDVLLLIIREIFKGEQSVPPHLPLV